MLRSLDLFSGVGGITHGLRGFATPVMYCEKDPDCHGVLRKLMGQGRLPRAPIHDDITKLTARGVPGRVDLIVAGFPCFPAGTLVNTDAGYVPIEAVTGDRMLLTHTGQYKPINNLQRKLLPAGERMYSITIRGLHRPIQCTEEHPFYVRRMHIVDGVKQYSPPEFVDAKDLTEDHVVGIPIDQRSVVPVFTVPYGSVDERTLRLSDPDQWWALGYFLGDGWIQDSRKPGGRLQYRITFVVAHKDEAIVVPRLKKVFHLTRADVAESCTKYVACNKAWWTVLQEFGRYAHGKKVPDWVHAAPTHLLKEFLDGYMAADGSKRLTPYGKENWRVASVSVEAALGIQRAFAKIGLAFGVRHNKKRPHCTIEGRCVNQRDNYEVGGQLEFTHATRRRYFIDGAHMWCMIRRIRIDTTEEPQWVYNFEVADDNSYCVENVAVHNCIGFSNGGHREGLDQPGSRLFYHVMRLAKEIRPPLMFFENVEGILGNDDIHKIVRSIRSLGYSMYWIILKAYNVGAPQKRARWFCLAIRNGVHGLRIKLSEPYTRFNWRSEPAVRMVPEATPDVRRRMRMLGNSAVPDCVRAAFLSLWTGCTVPIPRLLSTTSPMVLTPPKPLGPVGANKKYVAVIDGAWQRIPEPPGMLPRPRLNLVLVPGAYKSKKPPSDSVTSGLVKKPMRIEMWSTPRAGNGTYAMTVLTNRGSRDLGSQLRFERRTPAAQRKGVTNPEFAEHLMGFPRGWTSQ